MNTTFSEIFVYQLGQNSLLSYTTGKAVVLNEPCVGGVFKLLSSLVAVAIAVNVDVSVAVAVDVVISCVSFVQFSVVFPMLKWSWHAGR